MWLRLVNELIGLATALLLFASAYLALKKLARLAWS
jgi:hypothetical protein